MAVSATANQAGLNFGNQTLSEAFSNLNSDFHAQSHVFDRAANDVGDQARSFVQIDPGDDVGNIALESFRGTTADDLAKGFLLHGEILRA